MSDLSAVHIPVAIWGFLLGFVGWSSCFRLIEPISNWLFPSRANATAATAITQAMVAVFLVSAMITAMATLPAIIIAADGSITRDNAYWRSLLGVAFMSAIAGLSSLGFLRRFSAK